MLSALVGKRYKDGKKVLVMQHRDELVDQNKSKFERLNPYITTSIVNGTERLERRHRILYGANNIQRQKPHGSACFRYGCH